MLFLDYVDDVHYWQSIQKALNRGESYHQLAGAIPYADGGKLRAKSEEEQKILGECSRLIANCIILYNATILSELLFEAEKRGSMEEAEIIKKISPVAWQHINLYGKY